MLMLTKANLKEHCRTCLKWLDGSTECNAPTRNVVDLPDSKNLHFSICNDPELQQLLCINVDDSYTSDILNPVVNDFPENVCLACYNKLYSFATFRRKAQESAEKLRIVLNGSGNIKVELNFGENEEDRHKIKSSAPSGTECEFQLHDATAENEETFFETSVANLADVEMNDDTVDPFSPSAPTISECSDKEMWLKEDETKEVKENKLREKLRPRRTKPPKIVKQHKYMCPQCNQYFAKNAELTDHVNQVHAFGSTPFLCDHCDKSYRNLRSLKEHVVQAHQDKIKSQVHFQCTECSKAFLDSTSLKHHMTLHFKKKKTQVCGICNESFPVKKWLIDHLRTHTPDGRIPCAECDKTYKRYTDLENHKRAAHLKEKPHHCKICDKSFQNKQSFRIHNYRHSGKKPYLCDICGKDFRQRTAMKTHRSTHLKDSENN